ncbi:hypothetical protein PoHVEF18_005865 [Penicillium ochrochloron]
MPTKEDNQPFEGDTHASPKPVSPHPEPPFTIFDKRQKWLIVFIVSFAATFSGFASNIYFPALPTIADGLNVSLELVNLTVTSYLIFQDIAPSFWGPVSDVKGRRIAYACTFVVFLGACIGLAETKNYATLIVLRCLQSTGSASTIAIGSGVIGDITTRADRGGFMGIFQAGLLVPVAVGPVIGGAIAAPPQLGARKQIDVLGPFKILITKHACPIIVFLAIYYAVWQMSITAMSSLFKTRYGLTEIQIGLTFIANGVGSMVGTLITSKALDFDYRKVKASFELQPSSRDGESGDHTPASQEDFPLEKARLRLVPVFSGLQCLSILLFGWTIQYPNRVHIAVPIISTFITGWTAVSTQSVIMTYLVDVFHDRSAAASASLNLARCLFAAGGTSFVIPMIDKIGVGPAFTICVAVQVIALIGPLIQWRYAAGWRKEAEMASEFSQ